MKRNLACLLVVIVSAIPCFAQDFPKTFGPVDLSNGDTLVFLGDSITHQCLHTQYIEDYYYTRYPTRRIHFHNAGVGGDRAGDTLVRFDEDVAKYDPKYVTILIGMNDGRYQRLTDEILNTYKKDMTTLLDRIEGIGATPIPMTPTMFDLRSVQMGESWLKAEALNEAHYSATLAFFGAWLMQQANDRGLGFVNMYEPLNRITREQRRADPTFTMIRDAVHPDPEAQLVMALALLNDIGADPVVSNIHVDRSGDRWIVEAENGSLSDVEDDRITFTFTANSLPWVVPEAAALGYTIANAGHSMSRETFRVTGLAAGNYKLNIDDQTVGVYGHVELAAGIELQSNSKTPQYRQAMEVAMLNKKRNEEVVHELRDLWLSRKSTQYRHEHEAARTVWKYNENRGGDWTATASGMWSPEEAIIYKYTVTKWDKDAEHVDLAGDGWLGINGFDLSGSNGVFHWVSSSDGDNVHVAGPGRSAPFEPGSGDLAFRLGVEGGEGGNKGQEPASPHSGQVSTMVGGTPRVAADNFAATGPISGITFWGYWLDAAGEPIEPAMNQSGFNIWFYRDDGTGKPVGGFRDSTHEKVKEWETEFEEQVAELNEKAKQFEDEIYSINRPRPHRYELGGM